jgi:signal transduction histidine kinase
VKLFSRYSRINALFTVGIFAITCLGLYFVIFQVLVAQLDHNFLRIQHRMQAYVSAQQELPGPQVLDDLRVYYTAEKDSLFGGEHFESTHFYDSTLGKDHRFRKFFFPIKVKETWYQVTLIKPLEGPHHVASAILYVSIAVILLLVLASYLLNRLAIKRLLSPFYQTMDALRGFTIGSTQPLPLPQTDIEEFAFMNECLKSMTGKAAEDYRLLKEFTENASHEIQTPLAIIRSKLDLVIQDAHLSEAQSEKLRSAYAALKRISRLNQSLLLIAKIENRQYNRTETLSVHDKLTEKLIQFQELWENSHLQVQSSIEPANLQVNPELLDILLNNLLSNATRHNCPQGIIEVRLQPGKLEISNSGMPSPLNKDRLFRRFYKEIPNSEQVGLGLSIIHQICEVTGIALAYRFKEDQHIFALNWG